MGNLKFQAPYNGSLIDYAYIYASSNNLSGVRGSLNFSVKSTSGTVVKGMTLYGSNDGPRLGVGEDEPSVKIETHEADNLYTPQIKVRTSTSNVENHLGLSTNNIEFYRATGTGVNFELKTNVHYTSSGGNIVFSPQSTSSSQNFTPVEQMRLLKTGQLAIGNTTASADIHISRVGDASIIIEADRDNVGENDNPTLILKQDGGAIEAKFGINGDAGNSLSGYEGNAAYLQSSGSLHIAPGNGLLGTFTSTRFDLGTRTWTGYGSNPSGKMNVEVNGGRAINIYNTAENYASLSFIDSQSNGAQSATIEWSSGSGNPFKITNMGNVPIYILDSGNVGIKKTTGISYALDVTGDIRASADVIAYSDKRVKKDIKTIDNALEKVTKLRGVSYKRSDVPDNKTKIGVIAQEVKEVLPEVVSKDEQGLYAVSYGKMAGVFIEAIKDLKTEINELKQEIKELKK